MPRGDIGNIRNFISSSQGDHAAAESDGGAVPAASQDVVTVAGSTIWGTNLVVEVVQRRVRDFLESYTRPEEVEPFYPRYLSQVLAPSSYAYF